jgi:hypothetical protein
MIRVGGIVPLVVQLEDGNESARVHARVSGPADETFFDDDLPSVGGGKYQMLSLLMPDVEFLIATYQIFGVTKNGGEYGRGSETFFRDACALPGDVRSLFDEYAPKLDDFLTGQITEEATNDGFMEGLILGDSQIPTP